MSPRVNCKRIGWHVCMLPPPGSRQRPASPYASSWARDVFYMGCSCLGAIASQYEARETPTRVSLGKLYHSLSAFHPHAGCWMLAHENRRQKLHGKCSGMTSKGDIGITGSISTFNRDAKGSQLSAGAASKKSGFKWRKSRRWSFLVE